MTAQSDPITDALTRGFPPILGDDPRVLILGSLPSVASVKAGQYYGHPRNAFWPIMGSLFGFEPTADYGARCAALTDAGVAVWDVLQAAERPGSLDSAIRRTSEQVNPLIDLIESQPSLKHLFFNGSAAEQVFRRHIGQAPAGITVTRLPSTSPANAAMRMADKQRVWRAVAAACADPGGAMTRPAAQSVNV